MLIASDGWATAKHSKTSSAMSTYPVVKVQPVSSTLSTRDFLQKRETRLQSKMTRTNGASTQVLNLSTPVLSYLTYTITGAVKVNTYYPPPFKPKCTAKCLGSTLHSSFILSLADFVIVIGNICAP